MATLGAYLVAGGCAAVGFFGALEDERRRNSTHEVEAEYDGFEGKNLAVVIMADRVIQSNFPGVAERIAARVTAALAENLKGIASGYVPAADAAYFQNNNPGWVALPLGRVAEQLGVDRLVIIELKEYRLNEPGNQYLWDGVASGSVSVVEADSSLPDARAFERPVHVTYPDDTGFGPETMSTAVVTSELSRRFATRAAWLLYTHQEPYYPDF